MYRDKCRGKFLWTQNMQTFFKTRCKILKETDNFDYIQIKNFQISKDSIKKVKSQNTILEKNFVTYNWQSIDIWNI